MTSCPEAVGRASRVVEGEEVVGIRVGLARSASLLSVVGCLVVGVSCAPPSVPLTPFPEPGAGVVSVEPPDSVGPLRMRGTDLVDAAGRVVLLHGMNSVNKSAPFISLLENGSLGPVDREYLRRNGFNAVRLGVSYASMMPTPGDIDEAYLDQVVAVTDVLSGDGLWVQLDFHQDVFTGMPDWATPSDALGLSGEPPAFLSFIGWAAAYASPRSIRQWDSFLAGEPIVNGRSVASYLGDAAAALAGRVAESDHVIGIELLNEPFSGSAVVRCILEGCSDVEGRLADRHAEMTAAVRAAAPEMPVWVEPFAPTGYIAPGSSPSRPVPATSDGSQVGLAWHLYCHETDGGSPVAPPPATAIFCQQRFENGFANGAAISKKLNAPRILNEFGASGNPLDATLVTRLADQQFVSWIYWHYSAGTADDSPIPDVVESQIVRPYPQATAGTPGSLSFDPVTGAFAYRYLPDSSIDAPTSIVIPGRQYPDGYAASVTNGSITSAPNSGRLTVEPDASGTAITVSVSRV